MKKTNKTLSFAERLVTARKARGFTQKELADKIAVSRRVISYYEKETEFPPAHLLPDLSKILKVSIDELLGTKKLHLQGIDLKDKKLIKKLEKTLKLPKEDQKAVVNFIDALSHKQKK